jgi:hypothetical protein
VGGSPRTSGRGPSTEHLAQLCGESVGVTGLAVLAAEKAAVVAGKGDDRGPESLSQGDCSAMAISPF